MASNAMSPKRMCTEENSKKTNDKSFTPRDYQIEILETAKEKNTIACLGTGTGKTFIAVMLIKEFANDVLSPFDNGGKRIFFLVPTVPLVHQQSKTIKDHTELKVKGYSGDMNIDSWNKDKWTAEFISYEVLVMTAEIFRIIVDHAFIPLEKIRLLILDECHRAQGDHPYRQAMKCFINVDPSEMPRIFGLSASLINGKCKPSQLEKHLRELENTLRSSITTASDIVDLQRYGADPDEFLVYYQPYKIETDLFDKIRELKQKIKDEQTNFGRGSEYAMDSDLMFFDKPLRCLNSLDMTLGSLGPWCALKAAEIFSEELKTVLVKSHNVLLTEEQREVLNLLQSFLQTFIEKCKTLDFHFDRENIRSWPSKLQRLLEIFMAMKNSKKFLAESVDKKEFLKFQDDPQKYLQIMKAQKYADMSDIKICSIVFVEQRITSYVLQQWILEIKKIYPELSFLVPEFIVGHGSCGVKKTSMSEKQQKRSLDNFRKRKCNILISTCVLEEGMDVQQCNAVIRFDLPRDFRSYVQSKGRARAKNSIYVMMAELGENASRFWMDLINFKTIEKMLLSKCHGRSVPEEDEIVDNLNDDLIPPYMPYGPRGPRITLISSISLINRYCATLPSDMATKLTAKWILREIELDNLQKVYECTLKMPINSPLRQPIKGPQMVQKKLAKMAAALEACKLLDEIGELNEHLVPISCVVDKALEEEIGPMEEEDGDGAQPGTKRRRQVYSKHVPIFLQNSRPTPLNKCYLHILKMELVEPLPKTLNPRNRPLVDPADTSRGLAILLSKKLPSVNSFPVFTKSGKLKVTVSLCNSIYFLSEDEIQTVEKFHKFIFSDALHIDKKKFFNPAFSKSPFYIVPVDKDDKSRWCIDWQFMSATESHPYNILKLKTSKTIGQLNFDKNLFTDAVLLRTYTIDLWKREKPTFHHVIKVRQDASPSSVLDSTSQLTFKEYYKNKYDIEIKDDDQPLVETYQDGILHRWKPIYVSVKETFDNAIDLNQKLSKTKQRRKNYREYLIPALSLIHPFPSSFFHKVQSLPTILFRLHSLLLAEELRQSVAASAFAGTVELQKGFQWPHFSLETSDKELKKHLAKNGENVLVPENVVIPVDIKKLEGKIASFENKIDLSNHPGPNLSLLLQGLTSKSAGDEFDLERLEMIGDSFLKFAMSVKTYIQFPNFDEGKLTRLRSRLIQNLHLYQRAKKRNIPEFLIHTPFSCRSTWLPPCYRVDEPVDLKISNYKSKTEETDKEAISKYLYFTKQIISDKCIADAVEAVIGAYLLSCGQRGALMFMSWLGLNPLPHKKDSEAERSDFENWPPEPPNPIVGQVPNVEACLQFHTKGCERFECNIKYKFKNRALLLQAFTHPSYSYNEITDCYQRLEFLGDAVLDFLITRKLYEDHSNHSPGKLTDLRSALVNNIYFASLAVKYEYHKHLKHQSHQFFGLVNHYLDIYTESESFRFFKEYGYNLEEIECFELDEVEVPKALGDIFESVAGAIYLDSGMSLDAVWKIYYPMIKPAMEHLTEHVPISPVRELHEILKKKDVFETIVQKEDKCYVKVVLPSGEEVVGVGPNKKVAKNSAAKRAVIKLKADNMVE